MHFLDHFTMICSQGQSLYCVMPVWEGATLSQINSLGSIQVTCLKWYTDPICTIALIAAIHTHTHTADTSIDTLYHLAKKMEVRHQLRNMPKGGNLTHNPHKGYKKYSTPEGCVATVEADLFPPDPELVESTPSKPDHIEGLSLRITQAMNHYQKQEHQCFMCRDTGHFMRDCPHCEAFCAWHKEHLISLGVGQKNRMPIPKKWQGMTRMWCSWWFLMDQHLAKESH